MAIRSRRPLVLLGAVLAIFACEVEEISTLEIAVSVEPPVEVSSFPAQVLVGFDSSGSGFVVFRVGFLCAPDAPFSTTVTFPARRGDEPTAVDAFLVPVEPGSAFACGPLAAPEAVPFPGGPGGVPRASAGFVIVGGCGVGDVRSATLVIGRSS